uniref:CASP-like protein n=1 Tax=Mesocestoides corti TaxID=53468 RepID=A0A5K3FJM8_MESCO
MLDVALAVISGALAASVAAWSKATQQQQISLSFLNNRILGNAEFIVHYGFYVCGNILMWLTFVMALKKSSNVVTVVILNSVCNLLLLARGVYFTNISVLRRFLGIYFSVNQYLLHGPLDSSS